MANACPFLRRRRTGFVGERINVQAMATTAAPSASLLGVGCLAKFSFHLHATWSIRHIGRPSRRPIGRVDWQTVLMNRS